MKTIPNSQLLAEISQYIQKQGGKNYCLFLLDFQSGLRVSEAVNFNLEAKALEPNFYLVKSKGKTRSVYISPSVISELKAQNWQPNSTSRHGFHKFLKKTKKKLKIDTNIELTPHTLRRCFATYYAENGVPLPILTKALGHKNLKTTALYWKGEKEINDKLIKEWLDKITFPTREISPPKVVKDKEYWKIYNAKPERKKYLAQKQKERRVKKYIQPEYNQLLTENQQLQTKIKELQAIISRQQEQPELKTQILYWKPKNYV